uniref:Uncharacterized protein n=1 Tax=Tetradesmus obliquus TaxID=3088 RepID=A0A383VCK9_TETOB|eukprot:jgi/Sobl393_1/9688/SZX62462.1
MAEVLTDLRTLIPGEIIDGFTELNEFWKWLPFAYVFAGHCLFCSLPAKEFRDRCFVHYVLTFLWGNGGGVVSALLLMAPQHAKLSFFATNEVLGIWTVCWWLVNYCPGGLVYNVLNKRYIKMFAASCTALMRALLIVSRVDLAVKLYPGIVAAPLLLGTLAGCGGRLLADTLLHSWGALPGHAELSSPGFVSRSAAMAATTYYLLAYVLQLLPASAAAGFVVTWLVLHTFVKEISGHALDFTAPVAKLLHTLTLVPHPPPQPLPAPVSVFRRSGSFEFPNAAAAKAAGVSSPVAIGQQAKAATTPAKTPASASKGKASPAKGSPAGKRSPASKGSPAKAAAAAAAAHEPAASPAGAEQVCSVQPQQRAAGHVSAAASAAGVVKAGEASVPAEASLAATRPRRSQRKAVAA